MDSAEKLLQKPEQPSPKEETKGCPSLSNHSPPTKPNTEKKRAKRVGPSLSVLTGRRQLSQQLPPSQLNTPVADFTPFHSPSDPTKLNIDGPNWHLFNKTVSDSLEKLTQLKICDDSPNATTDENEKKL